MKIKTAKSNELLNNALDYDDANSSPFGIKLIQYILAKSNFQLDKQKVMEIGCGIGSRINFLAPTFDKIIGVDNNKDNLNVTKAMCKKFSFKNVKLKNSQYKNLPAKKNDLDLIFSVENIGNLFSYSSQPIIKEYTQIVNQASKSLKSNGFLILNTSSHYQIQNCFWWTQFLPDSMNRLLKEIPDLDQLLNIILDHEFSLIGVYEYSEELLIREEYHNPLGPLNKRVKENNFILRMSDNNEYKKAIGSINQANSDGSIYEIMDYFDKNIKNSGQSTFIVAQRN